MNKAFEKIFERLKKSDPQEMMTDEQRNVLNYAKQIVQEVAEEYNNGWIPCNEKMPEPHILILVCENNGEIHLCRYHNKSNRYFYDGSDWDIKESEVIAWMPLPEPYNDNKNE